MTRVFFLMLYRLLHFIREPEITLGGSQCRASTEFLLAGKLKR
ncbi:hypothetical protein SNOG_05575 [Parastagonospora nodorum SN15]|uniref:Uncharacterized protein n=1 Tax=Phaeosphaeria nodorum (strain SN15 / ATCC MYA-4574 / FGSC 10173) TaxID=321614 RepID=Q0URN9_PHANO|nr:hypothetical protein SNOG_05575 [Parastagonospora nodorum SN15]EAT86639.1 hypothetical protein SNOG_05575 [Parastagonospora nodorum SN15]